MSLRLRLIVSVVGVAAVLLASATSAGAQTATTALDFDGDGKSDLTYVNTANFTGTAVPRVRPPPTPRSSGACRATCRRPVITTVTGLSITPCIALRRRLVWTASSLGGGVFFVVAMDAGGRLFPCRATTTATAGRTRRSL